MLEKEIKFSIITPTHNRLGLLQRCTESIISQSYKNWEMLVVDDSTDDKVSKSAWRRNLDARIKYFKNEKNMGANYSRNLALDNARGDFVIFLDDDDILNTDCLRSAVNTIHNNPEYVWYLSNKVYKSGKKSTFVKKYNIAYSYTLDYLLGTKIDGDCTDCIKLEAIGAIRFPTDVKNGGEWEFFSNLGVNHKIFTYDFPSITIEYLDSGLSNNLNTTIFLLKTKLRMIRLLPKIEPQTPLMFLYITTFLSIPPIIYIYDITKKILRKSNLLLLVKGLLTRR